MIAQRSIKSIAPKIGVFENVFPKGTLAAEPYNLDRTAGAAELYCLVTTFMFQWKVHFSGPPIIF
jgi:hypothetical protein